jgi:hypothetical protein
VSDEAEAAVDLLELLLKALVGSAKAHLAREAEARVEAPGDGATTVLPKRPEEAPPK